MTIYLVSIEHKHGTDLYAFETINGASDHLYSYVSDWWPSDLPPIESMANHDDAVSLYFEDHETEFYSVQKTEVGA